MRSKYSTLVVLVALCLIVLGHNAWGSTLPETHARQIYGRRALTFEQNLGQTKAEARFLARGSGYTVFATREEIILTLKAGKDSSEANVVRLSWEGADAKPEPQPAGQKVGVVNYLIGNENEWHTGIPAYSRVAYRSIYRGTDLVLYGIQKHLEFDFKLAPGADPSRIALSVGGVERLFIAGNGDLVMLLKGGGGELRQHKPVIYQAAASGRRVPIRGEFKLLASNRVGFAIGPYDRSRELVIDPTLVYSTYLGGTGDDVVFSLAVDGSNRVYATGETRSDNFPKKNARDATRSGVDAFVTKFFADGAGLFYSTYLGGGGTDRGQAIAVDRDGNAYVVGSTTSTNFPGSTIGPISSGGRAFAVKLSPTGSTLSYARRFGGSQSAVAAALALDSNHNAYVIGTTDSHDFPTTAGVLQRSTTGDIVAYVMKLSSSGSLVYSTMIGNATQTDGLAIAVDGSGNVYAAGDVWSGGIPTTGGSVMPDPPAKDVPCGICRVMTGWVVKLNSSASSVIYGTYLGGNNEDVIFGIAVDSNRNAYVTGSTGSTNFPTTGGAKQKTNQGNADAFVTKLSPAVGRAIYSTYLGGAGFDVGRSIAVNSAGHAFVAGYTESANFPVVNAIQPTYGIGQDAFVTKLWATGSGYHYSTYLGGSELDAALSVRLDGAGNAYVGGYTVSSNFPTTPGVVKRSKTPADGEDGVVLKIK